MINYWIYILQAMFDDSRHGAYRPWYKQSWAKGKEERK